MTKWQKAKKELGALFRKDQGDTINEAVTDVIGRILDEHNIPWSSLESHVEKGSFENSSSLLVKMNGKPLLRLSVKVLSGR